MFRVDIQLLPLKEGDKWKERMENWLFTRMHSGQGIYDLSTITTGNVLGKYSLLTAMLICPVIMIFYIDFFFLAIMT